MKPSIEFSHVTKRYRVGLPPLSLRALIQQWRRRYQEQFHNAVNDVSFQLQPGESMGIIGPNGAGKTTILKLLSKVTFPTSGSIRVNGRYSSLIELGAGFHPDLTGRENIFLNGAILGMKKREIQARFDQIVEFAEIGKFLDTPVKRYSSGMYARLGFAVAAHVDPEVLIVDEVLAVGDMAFQRKCYEHMVKMIENGTTMVFVSHNLRAVQKVCARCLVMYRGNAAFEGPTPEATANYSNILRTAAAEYSKTNAGLIESGISQQIMTHEAVIEQVKLLREDGSEALSFQSGENVILQVKVRFNQQVSAPIFACVVRTPEMQVVYDFTTHWANLPTPDFEAGTVATIEYQLKLNLSPGTFYMGVNIAYQDLTRYYDRMDRALDFVVTSNRGSRGIADLQASFRVSSIEPALPEFSEETTA